MSDTLQSFIRQGFLNVLKLNNKKRETEVKTLQLPASASVPDEKAVQ